MNKLVLTLLFVLIASIPLTGQEKTDSSGTRCDEGEVLSKIPNAGTEKFSISLLKITPPVPPFSVDRLLKTTENSSIKFIDISTFKNQSGNIVLCVVKEPFETSKTKTGKKLFLGSIYAYKDFTSPLAVLASDLIIDERGKGGYLILGRIKFQDLTLAVYRINYEQVIADNLPVFDLNQSDKWIKPLDQLSEIKTQIKAACSSNKIKAELDFPVLKINLSQTDSDCVKESFFFNLSNKKWTDEK